MQALPRAVSASPTLWVLYWLPPQVTGMKVTFTEHNVPSAVPSALKYFLSYFSSLTQQGGTMMISILQMRGLRLKKGQ